MIDFSGYTRKNIQKDMLSQVDDRIDKRQGSVVQNAIGPVAWYLEGAYMKLDQIQKNAYSDTAAGSGLDFIVKSRGIVRKQATAAVRQGNFNVEIQPGSTFKTINGQNSLIFTSGEKISENEGVYAYEIICNTAGTEGNGYTGPLIPITAISGLTLATIGTVINYGIDEESDEALRERYDATFETESFGGNIAAYREAILEIEGIRAVQVYPTWKGGGTVLCSVLGDDLKPVPSEVVKKVQDIICPSEDGEESPSPNGYGMAPIGANVTISTANELTLNITCDIEFIGTLQNGVEIYQKEIEEKIQEYLDTVNKSWGNPLKTHKISYPVTVYISRITHAILTILDIVNVKNVMVNGSVEDVVLIETPEMQQVPVLGTVVINGE